LRIACGLLAPDRGNVRVRRFDLESEPQECKRRLGFLPAGSSGLYARLTTRQQLEYWSRLAFVPSRERERVVLDAIERFGLIALAESRLDRISMGERQRVRLAMTFLHGPDLVLLDEARTSLDSAGVALLVDAIADVRSRGGAALWCAPSGDPLPLAVDTQLVIRGGRLEPA
jgi:sodium transport system ATP-binding protein